MSRASGLAAPARHAMAHRAPITEDPSERHIRLKRIAAPFRAPPYPVAPKPAAMVLIDKSSAESTSFFSVSSAPARKRRRNSTPGNVIVRIVWAVRSR